MRCKSQCPDVHVGDYVVIRGEKVHDEAEAVFHPRKVALVGDEIEFHQRILPGNARQERHLPARKRLPQHGAEIGDLRAERIP